MPDSPPETGVDELHFELDFGWRKTGTRRWTGRWDWILFAPSGDRLTGRSQSEVFLSKNPGVPFNPATTHHYAPWSKKKVSGLDATRGVGPPKKQYPRLNLFNTV